MPDALDPTLSSEDDVRRLEKLIGLLKGLHTEMSVLARKSPNDGVNHFKLGLINDVLCDGNALLTGSFVPLVNFRTFLDEKLPSNSDVTLVLALYIEQAERFRSNNMVLKDFKWRYLVNGAASTIEGSPPSMIGETKK